MSSITFQYLIPNFKNDELLHIIGGMTKEFIQETFNCLAASVILLIDECFDIFSCDYKALESSAAAVFDLLLHMLSSPQSSVTLLRTLGGKFVKCTYPITVVFRVLLMIVRFQAQRTLWTGLGQEFFSLQRGIASNTGEELFFL